MSMPTGEGQPGSGPAAGGAQWPELNTEERRVLGVLVEKAKTTPDVYPLSINALVAGCNQKSNRDPVLNLEDVDAEEALARLQGKGLAIKITGGRVIRWRHNLYEAWHVDKVELAVLGELLLRGPQTEGELRGRASRMEAIDDLDTLRSVLRRLAERGLVVYLSPEGRRGTVVTHGFHSANELTHLRETRGSEGSAEESATRQGTAARSTSSASPASTEQLAELEQLRERVEGLEGQVSRLQMEIREIRELLGDRGGSRGGTGGTPVRAGETPVPPE